jgi:NADPH-dependent 2,4-dienoyl-CoA reductase/sulfur reductase-like enzyme
MLKREKTDVLVIGGGAAGMACALSAAKEGVYVTLLERESSVGGVLNQCIHNGFGLQFYHQELTGPEFASRLIDEMNMENVKIINQSYVRDIDVRKRVAQVLSPDGAYEIQAGALVISTRCQRETVWIAFNTRRQAFGYNACRSCTEIRKPRK